MSRKITLAAVIIAVVACVFTACSGGSSSAGSPNTEIPEKYSTTKAQKTVGKEQTSQKVELSGGDYEINYYDANGAGTKQEHYKNGKLAYYYVAAAVDENGNCLRQEYYSPKDKLLCTYENGFFFNPDGEQISEDEAQVILNEYM